MNPFSRICCIALALLPLLSSCRSTPPEHRVPRATEKDDLHGESLFTMSGEPYERYYILYVPASYDPSVPAPLVVMLHGGGGTPGSLITSSRMNRQADAHGFIVAYPSGTGANPKRLFWNVLSSHTFATENNVDDIGFIGRLIDDISSRINVDGKRIFASGISQGGMLCYRLACDPVMSSRIAAIAPVAAVMTVPADQCAASRPVPLISFNGREDGIILYNGGISSVVPRNDRISRPGVLESVLYWVKAAGLSLTPNASGERGSAVMQQYGEDEQGFEVVLWTLNDGGHTWPGGIEVLPNWLVGRVNNDIDASALIWDFFSRHQLP